MLAKASNDSAADISYMGEALKYAGTPAHALGVTMEDTSAAIEVMSNSGLKENKQVLYFVHPLFVLLNQQVKRLN